GGRSGERWPLWVEEVPADVVWTGKTRRVGEHDHAPPSVRVEGHESSITAGATVVPEDRLPVRSEDVPGECNLHPRSAGGTTWLQHRLHCRRERRLRVADGRRQEREHVVRR